MLGTTNASGITPKTDQQNLTIQINGSTAITYNGGTAKSLNISLSSLGAAASNHNHDSVYSKLGHTHSKADVGLGYVDNTADSSKNVNSSLLVNGYYSGNGGKQPPSFIPSGKVRFLMSNENGSYTDWLYMDTYSGSDVPYVSAIGLEKTSNPALWIMSGPKNGSTWTIKRRVATFSSNPVSGQFLSADGSNGHIKTSGYSAGSFATSGHSHTNLTTFNFATDQRSVGTAPNDYNGILKYVGLKALSTLGISTGTGIYAGLIGMRQWGDSSGGDSHEIAVSNNNSIWSRAGATTGWGAWSLICCTNSKAVISQSTAPCMSGIWAY